MIEEKDGHPVAIFLINPPDYPLVFEKVGTYPIDGSKYQQTVFGQGTIFFRHGAKTESGTSDDLRRFMLQRVREMEEQLVKGLRKVSESPRGSQLSVAPTNIIDHSGMSGLPIRITTDVNAQGAIAIDRGKVCPYRQKEVIAILKERLPNGPVPTSHDLLAINKVYNRGFLGRS